MKDSPQEDYRLTEFPLAPKSLLLDWTAGCGQKAQLVRNNEAQVSDSLFKIYAVRTAGCLKWQRREDGPGVLTTTSTQMPGDLKTEGRGVHLVSEQEVAISWENRRGGWEGSEDSQREGRSRSRTDLK